MFKRKLLIVDTSAETGAQQMPLPLSASFARNLDTVEKAREWLTNPCSWRDGGLFILKWDGLVPYVSKEHGKRLRIETWDNDIPITVVRTQMKIREGTKVQDEDPASS